MTTELPELVPSEVRLLEALQPLTQGNRELPDACEIERGHFLRMVLDAWTIGAKRDGRKGHLSDAHVAQELERRTGERFDRNRFQAMFGLGKKMPDGTRQPQPVSRPVAGALLEIALKNWHPSPATAEGNAPDETPFPQLEPSLLDTAITTALDAIFDDPDRDVRCRLVVGHGWKGLYRELGAAGCSVVVIARDDALRMRNPKKDIFDLADILDRLLRHERSRAVGAKHIWAIRRPDGSLGSDILVREFDGINTLKARIKTMQYLGMADHPDWPTVDLDRCVVAEARPYDAHADLFKLRVGARVEPEMNRPEEPIAVLAVNPEHEVRFYTFSLERSPGVAAFVQRFDLPAAVKEDVLRLVQGAAGEDQDGWVYHKAVDFANNWDWQVDGEKGR